MSITVTRASADGSRRPNAPAPNTSRGSNAAPSSTNAGRGPNAGRQPPNRSSNDPGSSRESNGRRGARASVQSRLTEDTFANFLDGFQAVEPEDLVEARGGRVRYVVETRDAWGGLRDRKFRLGGWLSKVDPQLRYLKLFNPYAKKSWSVQLRSPDTVVRLYYMPPGTSDEVATMRRLYTMLENGEIKITTTR